MLMVCHDLPALHSGAHPDLRIFTKQGHAAAARPRVPGKGDSKVEVALRVTDHIIFVHGALQRNLDCRFVHDCWAVL